MRNSRIADAGAAGKGSRVMVNFQDRTVHMVAVLLYPAAKLADVIERQADSLLPERQLLIDVVFGKFHSRFSRSGDGFHSIADFCVGSDQI
jgi:hypothetical protein